MHIFIIGSAKRPWYSVTGLIKQLSVISMITNYLSTCNVHVYGMLTKLKRNNLCLRSFFEIEMPLWRKRHSFIPLYIGYHRNVKHLNHKWKQRIIKINHKKRRESWWDCIVRKFEIERLQSRFRFKTVTILQAEPAQLMVV